MEKDGDQSASRKKKFNQWFFNITKFSNELLEGLNNLSEWPKVKLCSKTGLENPMDVK